jgi:hypothetical protein
VKVRALTTLAMELAHLIDTGKYDGVSMEEACNAMESKDVLGWLKRQTGDDSDLSPFRPTGLTATSAASTRRRCTGNIRHAVTKPGGSGHREPRPLFGARVDGADDQHRSRP